MLTDNLLSILAALGEVQGNAQDADLAALVRCCRNNLKAAIEQAEELEKCIIFSADDLQEVI